MSQSELRLIKLLNEQVTNDLRETVQMNLALIGVVITNAQLDGLVQAVVARLDGELQLRQRRHQFVPKPVD